MPAATRLSFDAVSEGAWQAHELPAAFASAFGHHFLLALPEGYAADAARAWPLVVFLHGRGEWGDDLARVRTQGVGALIDSGRRLPAIVVAPQSPEAQMWQPDFVDAVLRCVQANCRVDARRISLTGLSMGAMGCLAVLAAFPQRFAAVALIAGSFPNDMMSRRDALPLGDRAAWRAALAKLRGLPVWLAHGDADEVVPVELGRRVADLLHELGTELRCTWQAGVGHDSWTAIYRDTPDFWPWLLAHAREPGGAGSLHGAAARWAGRYVAGGDRACSVTAEGDRVRIRWEPSGIEDLCLPGEAGCYAGTMLIRFADEKGCIRLELPGMGVLTRVRV